MKVKNQVQWFLKKKGSNENSENNDSGTMVFKKKDDESNNSGTMVKKKYLQLIHLQLLHLHLQQHL